MRGLEKKVEEAINTLIEMPNRSEVSFVEENSKHSGSSEELKELHSQNVSMENLEISNTVCKDLNEINEKSKSQKMESSKSKSVVSDSGCTVDKTILKDNKKDSSLDSKKEKGENVVEDKDKKLANSKSKTVVSCIEKGEDILSVVQM